MALKPIPQGYHTATPYLIVKGAAKALEFYKRAFGARETMRFTTPDGEIGHAEIRIGESPIMLADEYPEMGYRSPHSIGGTPVGILLYVENRKSVGEGKRGDLGGRRIIKKKKIIRRNHVSSQTVSGSMGRGGRWNDVYT